MKRGITWAEFLLLVIFVPSTIFGITKGYEYLADKQLPVKVVMTVHDQIDTICKDSYVKSWSKTLTYLMEKAAKKVVTNGLLKADVNISKVWEK